MSRLDAFVHRVHAQRACIDAVAAKVDGRTGPVLEVGLGNGRTYDHLRVRFADRAIFVFDRAVEAHPDCIPPGQFLRLGDFRSSIPAYLAELQPPAVFIHADVGSSNKAASMRLAEDLAPSFVKILAPGGFLACDQPLDIPAFERLPLPDSRDDGWYHLYRRSDSPQA